MIIAKKSYMVTPIALFDRETGTEASVMDPQAAKRRSEVANEINRRLSRLLSRS